MKKQVILSILFLCFYFIPFAQETPLPSFLKDSIDGYVEKALKEWNIPGVSVAVVKDGKIVFIKGYGVKELGKPIR